MTYGGAANQKHSLSGPSLAASDSASPPPLGWSMSKKFAVTSGLLALTRCAWMMGFAPKQIFCSLRRKFIAYVPGIDQAGGKNECIASDDGASEDNKTVCHLPGPDVTAMRWLVHSGKEWLWRPLAP